MLSLVGRWVCVCVRGGGGGLEEFFFGGSGSPEWQYIP